MNETVNTLKKLAVSSVMIALGTVLSLIKIWQMPLGGSVTLLSMFPIIILSCYLGIGWGTASAFVFSAIQLMLGIMTEGMLGWGLTPLSLIGTIFLDYLVPFTLLGMAGLFAKRGRFGIYFGTAAVLCVRFLCHFVSGVIIFGIWSPWENAWLYSICYNGAFMLPELIFTIIAVVLFNESGASKQIKKLYDNSK